MRNDILTELGLSPSWQRRNRRSSAATPPAQTAPTAQTAAPSPTKPPTQTTAAAAAVKNVAENNNNNNTNENNPPNTAALSTLPNSTSAAAAKNNATAPPPNIHSATATSPTPTIDDSAIARMEWQPLRAAVAECVRCELCQGRTQAVFGVGDREADIVFVGEGPGYEEDQKGEPFVGPAGRLLDLMLKSIGMERGRGVYIANIVKCRPPKNRTPKPPETKACMAYLRRQMTLIKPRLIVALGGVAAANLLQTDEPVGKLRQRLHDYQGIPTVVTYHPAYLLRSPTEKRKSWDDLRHIRRLMAKTAD